jgi:hypothetical protein
MHERGEKHVAKRAGDEGCAAPRETCTFTSTAREPKSPKKALARAFPAIESGIFCFLARFLTTPSLPVRNF